MGFLKRASRRLLAVMAVVALLAALDSESAAGSGSSGLPRRVEALFELRHPHGGCSAKPGYDVASGWGSPNLVGLNDVALKAGRR